MLQEKHFGFYPDPLGIDAGPITISSRPDLQQIASDVLASDTVEDGWIYAPAQRSRDIVSGRVRQLPYPSRVFGLPHTHMIEHATGAHEDHLDFLIWALSFFVGMRLTPTEAGFLDATPLKPGKLVDFIVPGANLTRAVELAEDFWIKNLAEPGRAKLYAAAVHALFLGQHPQNLEFERFVYLYTAMDACYRLTTGVRGRAPGDLPHARRIESMCSKIGVETPIWADPTASGPEVVAIRNDTLHEALFMDAPLGFRGSQEGSNENLTLEMRALICRLLVALIGGEKAAYLRSPVSIRGTHRLDLSTCRGGVSGNCGGAVQTVAGD